MIPCPTGAPESAISGNAIRGPDTEYTRVVIKTLSPVISGIVPLAATNEKLPLISMIEPFSAVLEMAVLMFGPSRNVPSILLRTDNLILEMFQPVVFWIWAVPF